MARYERIMRDCSHCKAALASEQVEDATSQDMPPSSARPSRKVAPKTSSTAITPSAKPPTPTTGQGHSKRPYKQAASTSQPKASSTSQPKALSTSQPKASSSNTDAVRPILPTRENSVRLGETISGPSNTAHRPSSSLSNQNTTQGLSSIPSRSRTKLMRKAPSLDIRPTSLRPSASALETLLANNMWMNSTGSDPIRSITRRTRNDPCRQAEWVISANKMLGEVPLGWVWHAKLLQVDKSMLAAVATDTIPDDMIGAVDDTQSEDHLLRVARGFAHRHSVQRVNFQHLLLVCLCKVLFVRRVPQSSIIETLQICISDTSERNIGRYLRGASWANELLNRLFFTEWRYRAIDLLVLCKCGG